jgi:murein DD-endopeptidase MepM/ murein hydrolase activator NlpD
LIKKTKKPKLQAKKQVTKTQDSHFKRYSKFYSQFTKIFTAFSLTLSILIITTHLYEPKPQNPFILGLEKEEQLLEEKQALKLYINESLYSRHSNALVRSYQKRIKSIITTLKNRQKNIYPLGWQISEDLAEIKKRRNNALIALKQKNDELQETKKDLELAQKITQENAHSAASDEIAGQSAELKKRIFQIKDELEAINFELNQIENTTKLKELSFLRLQGLYYYYEDLQTNLQKRLSNFYDNDPAYNLWYQKRINDQFNAFPLAWPITPSRGISAGFRDLAYKRYFGFEHNGLDLRTDKSYPVFAISSGEVTKISRSCTFTYVQIKHDNGFESLYGHVLRFQVKKGDRVNKGDLIAYSGGNPGTCGSAVSTGSHLHLELKKNDEYVDPLYYFDLSLLPLEKIPPGIDLEGYFFVHAYADYDGDGLSNLYEYALQTDLYHYDYWREQNYTIKTNALEIDINDLL